MKKIVSVIICFTLVLFFSVFETAGRAGAVKSGLETASKGSILIDSVSGEVLFAQNENERYPIASMTKIMTLLLTFEALDEGRINLNDEIVVSEKASGMGGSQVFLDGSVSYKLSDLIKSVVVASANDASVALAEALAGSEENFVVKMNEKAKELGLENTVFVNATGLPAPGAYSSAHDVAIMFQNLIKHQAYFDFSKIYLDTLTHPSGRITQLANTNKLVRFYEGCDGGKTGSTSEAKFCLCATAKRGNMRVIACVIGCENAKSRNAQVSNLFNFAFSNFKNKILVNNLDSFDVPILKGNKKTFSASPKESFSILVSQKDNIELSAVPIFEENLKAPIKAGDRVGWIIASKNGNVIKKIELISNENVNLISYKNSILEILKSWAI